MNTSPHCCYIPPEEQAAAAAGAVTVGCTKPAEFDILPTDGDPNKGTQGCADHVGHLLSDGVNHVSPIEKESP